MPSLKISHRRRHVLVFAAAVGTLVSIGALALPATVVEVWNRVPTASGPADQKGDRVRIDLGTLPAVTMEMVDAQAQHKRTFRGVRLSSVLEKSNALKRGDLALLRFANGMVVPVPVTSGKPNPDPLIALSSRLGEGKWSTDFAPVTKRAEVTLDPRPITFGAHKVVVESLALPGLKDPTGESFSPWSHTDTLVGIEFVNRVAYERQFDPVDDKDESAKKGARVFIAACQYCHGVRDVGANYGWDFMLPFPMHTHRKPKDLYSHVTVAKAMALEEGLMMPVQKNITPDDVKALWAWSKAMSKSDKLRPYAP